MNIKDYLRSIIGNQIDKIDAYALMCHYLNKPNYFLRTHDDFELSDQQIKDLNQWAKRRQQGEPLAYILNYKEFYGRNFKVSPDTLIPRPETELIVDYVLYWLDQHIEEFLSQNRCFNLLDLGTGTACIPISIALEIKEKYPQLQTKIVAIDYYQHTLEIAQDNIDYHQTAIKLIQSNWLSALNSSSYQFDVITSNPPYIAYDCEHIGNDVKQFEPHQALFSDSDGLSDIQTIIQQSKNYLNSNGLILIEHGFNQGNSTQDLFYQNGYKNIQTIQDLAKLDRLTIASI